MWVSPFLLSMPQFCVSYSVNLPTHSLHTTLAQYNVSITFIFLLPHLPNLSSHIYRHHSASFSRIHYSLNIPSTAMSKFCRENHEPSSNRYVNMMQLIAPISFADPLLPPLKRQNFRARNGISTNHLPEIAEIPEKSMHRFRFNRGKKLFLDDTRCNERVHLHIQTFRCAGTEISTRGYIMRCYRARVPPSRAIQVASTQTYYAPRARFTARNTDETSYEAYNL